MGRSRAALGPLGALLLLSAVPAAALAGEIDVWPGRVDITSTTNGGWHSDLGYGELFERLNVATGTGAWHLALRLDTATFAEAPLASIEGRYTPEKITLGYSGRSLEVIAGDAYVSFGRGLALSLRKVDELGIDTTLRGGKVLVHAGDLGATLVAGYANLNNVDEASGQSIDDTYDLIGGVQGQVTLADTVTVGAHGTAFAFHDALTLVPGDPYQDRYFQVGPTVDAPRLTDWLGVYLEGVAQLRHVAVEPEDAHAFGFYGAATGYFGPATLLLEGKIYGDLAPIKPRLSKSEFAAVAYNNPPTAERVLQVIENPQREVAGGRARLDWSFSPALLTYVNLGLFRDTQGYDDPSAIGTVRPGTITDPYAGFEARWDDGNSWALFSGGWRTILLDGSSTLVRGDAHAELDAAQSLGGPWSLTLHALHLERRKFVTAILDETWREGTILLGARYRPWVAVSAGWDYTSEANQPKSAYFSGNVQWDITSSSSVRLFVGGTRGGLRCVSGVCRVFPPFEGAKLTVTLRF